MCQVLVVAHIILSWDMWDLVLLLGIKPGLPALGVQCLSHWTTKEVPSLWSFCVCPLRI